MNFKNFDPEDELQIYKIQESVENSCDRKSKKINNIRRRQLKGMIKTHMIGKRSGKPKTFAILRHKLEKRNSDRLNKIFRQELLNEPTSKDTMFNVIRREKKALRTKNKINNLSNQKIIAVEKEKNS